MSAVAFVKTYDGSKCLEAWTQPSHEPLELALSIDSLSVTLSSLPTEVFGRLDTAYVSRFAYDSILHHGAPLRFLAELAGSDRIMLGTDYSFPPADMSPLSTLAQAGFSKAEVDAIASGNALRLFPRAE